MTGSEVPLRDGSYLPAVRGKQLQGEFARQMLRKQPVPARRDDSNSEPCLAARSQLQPADAQSAGQSCAGGLVISPRREKSEYALCRLGGVQLIGVQRIAEHYLDRRVRPLLQHQRVISGRQLEGTRPFERVFRLKKGRLVLERTRKVESANSKHGSHWHGGPLTRVCTNDPRQSVHSAHTMLQCIEIFAADEVSLVQDNDICKGNLGSRLLAVDDLLIEVSCIDHRDDSVEGKLLAHGIIDEERLCNRPGICKARGLEHDTVELVTPGHEIAQDSNEISAHGATDAPVVHLEDLLLGVDHQLLVDADFAELVLDDGDPLAVTLGENAIQKRGLA